VIEESKVGSSGGRETQSPVSDQRFPDEPFACPACGQMLAPSCRVCVACKQPIDPSQIDTAVAESVRPTPTATLPTPEPVRFSWGIFFGVLSLWLFAAVLTTSLLGPNSTQVVLGSVVLISSLWVFYDAQKKGVSKPLRWGLGSLMLWLLFFPWYLARRRAPEAPCPSIEAELGPVTRVLLIILVVFFLLGIVSLLFKGLPVTQ
jgi:hypothetical protein